METLNLNSDSYTNSEIEKILHLSQPYSTDDIINAKHQLVKQLSNYNLGMEKQREFVIFIDSVANRIQNSNNNQNILNTSFSDMHRVSQYGSRQKCKN